MTDDAGSPPELSATAEEATQLQDSRAAPDSTYNSSAWLSGGGPPRPPTLAGTAGMPDPEVPGYEIVGELGRGGMGVVYLAKQEGFNRLVALKMILAGGHAAGNDLTRFRAEREALAALRHPNIIQVFDSGLAGGLPYFSLEFCDSGSLGHRQGLPIAARPAAELAHLLADALSAAHDAGMVHRDVKPANVLLQQVPEGSASGSGPVAGSVVLHLPGWEKPRRVGPRLTDFGLVKRDDADGPTQSGAVIGTPSFMAPEQAGGGTKHVGPPADIYSLGALLYDLLTGRPPFRGLTLVETLDQVLTREPVPPRRLVPSVPRDLDTICLKCLEKDPARRYPSARALADDLARHLDGRPIAARPAGRVERAARWCRRRPTQAALLGLIVFGGLLSVGLIAWQWRAAVASERVALEERQKADEYARQQEELRREAESAREAANLARARAEEEGRRATATAEFLTGLFRAPSPVSLDIGGPSLAGAADARAKLTALELVERGAAQAGEKLKGQPLTLASTLVTLADVYRGLGLHAKALTLLDEALAIRARELGPSHAETAAVLRAQAMSHQERGDFDRAAELARRALATQRLDLPEGHAEVLHTRMILGWALAMAYDPEAEGHLRAAAEGRAKLLGPTHADAIVAKIGLAGWLLDNGRVLEGGPLVLEVVKFSADSEAGKGVVEVISLFQKAMLNRGLGLHAAAHTSFEAAEALMRKIVGDRHMYLCLVQHEMAANLMMLKRVGEAEAVLKRCLEGARDTVGLRHPRCIKLLDSYTRVLRRLGRQREAVPYYEEALADNASLLGPNNRWRFEPLCDLAGLLAELGDVGRAEKIAAEALPFAEAAPGGKGHHADVLNAAAIELPSESRVGEAMLRRALALRTSYAKTSADDMAISRYNLAKVLCDTRRPGEALEHLWAARRAPDWDDLQAVNRFDIAALLGQALLQSGRFAEAEAELRAASQLAQRLPKLGAARFAAPLVDLAESLIRQGKSEGVAEALRPAAVVTRSGQRLYYEPALRRLILWQALRGEAAKAKQNLRLARSIFTPHAHGDAALRFEVLALGLGELSCGQAELAACHALRVGDGPEARRAYALMARHAGVAGIATEDDPILAGDSAPPGRWCEWAERRLLQSVPVSGGR